MCILTFGGTLTLLQSFVTKSIDASDAISLDEPMSEFASTPLSPEIDPMSIRGDGDGVGESVSDETVGKGDEVVELKAFVINIFGVDRPVSLLLFVDESGLGQIG